MKKPVKRGKNRSRKRKVRRVHAACPIKAHGLDPRNEGVRTWSEPHWWLKELRLICLCSSLMRVLWQSAEFQNKTALQKQKGGNLYSATRSGGGSVPSTRVLF